MRISPSQTSPLHTFQSTEKKESQNKTLPLPEPIIKESAAICLKGPEKPIETQEVPKDPRIKISRLKNGVTTYVAKQLGTTPGEASLRLVVKVGQRHKPWGIAHFIEHCTLMGSPSFPEDSFQKECEKMGCLIAADQNALTADSHTEYFLNIPVTDPKNLETAIKGLSEIAFKATLSDEAIESERKPILDELRLRGSSSSRMFLESYIRKVFSGTAVEGIIFDHHIEQVRTFTPEQIRECYQNWYTPDKMAIVAVGDIDTEETNRLIETYFGRQPSNPNPIEEKAVTLPKLKNTETLIHVDPLSKQKIALEFFEAEEDSEDDGPVTVEDLAIALVRAATLKMVSQRLSTPAYQLKNPPYRKVGISQNSMFDLLPTFSVVAVPSDNNACEALASLAREVRRAKEFGFSEQEIDRIRSLLLGNLEHEKRILLKENPASLSKDCASHFTDNIALLDPETVAKLKEHLIKIIDDDLCTEWLQKKLKTEKRLIYQIVNDPAKADPDALVEALQKADNEKLEPLTSLDQEVSLMPPPLNKGTVVTRTVHEGTDSVTYTLGNGMKVSFKEVSQENDIIDFSSTAPYGLLHTKGDERVNTEASEVIASRSGIGPLTHQQTAQLGINGYWNTSITSATSAFSARTVKNDFEKILQLHHLNFTNPGLNPEALTDAVSRLKEALDKLDVNPIAKLKRRVTQLVTGNNPVYQTVKHEDLSSINYKKAVSMRGRFFGDPADFHAVITGSIKEKELLPLILKYLATIPKGDHLHGRKAAEGVFPEGITEDEIFAGEQKCITTLNFPSEENLETPREGRRRRWLAGILSDRVTEKLRKILGESYSSDVDYVSPSHSDLKRSRTIVVFSSSSEAAQRMQQAVMHVIKDFKKNGPTQEEVDNLKTTCKRQVRLAETTSEGWNAILTGLTHHPKGFDCSTDFDDHLQTLNRKELQEAANYLTPERYCKVTLYPEKCNTLSFHVLKKVEKTAIPVIGPVLAAASTAVQTLLTCSNFAAKLT